MPFAGNSFPRQLRLRGKIRINRLFADNSGGFVYPFRYISSICDSEQGGLAVLVTVPKKNHKKAHDRNLLKRRTRESFRIWKNDLHLRAVRDNKQVHIALIYISKEEETYQTIEKSVKLIIDKVSGNI